MTVLKSKSVGVALLAMLFAVLLAAAAGTSAAAVPPAATGSAVLPAADSPSPTLGSTAQSNPEQPGDNDGNASDFTGTPLVFVAIALVLVLLVALTLLVFRGRRRKDQASSGRMKDRS